MSILKRLKTGLVARGVLKPDIRESGVAYADAEVPLRIRIGCGHGRIMQPTDVPVGHGIVTVHLAPVCAECLKKWLAEASTTCSTCGLPIVPGMTVSEAPYRGEHSHPFTHANFGCDEWGEPCGVWGDGQVMYIH